LNREGKLIQSFGISYEGKWKDGLMDGEMKMSTVVGGWIEGYWKYGVPHGFQREFGIKDFNDKVTMRFVGRYYRGLKRGFCWKGCWGTGFICGEVDKEGEFSGNDIAYIYPCFKMAIRYLYFEPT
jgi:histone-lysine N-methyltransferase SETD7